MRWPIPLLAIAASSCAFRPREARDAGDDGARDGTSAVDAARDSAPDAPLGPQISCAALLAKDPSTASGVYAIDPDGSGSAAPFEALCDMTTMNGGWTLVGRELVGSAASGSAAGPLRYLGIDSMNDALLAAGSASGIIGVRFAGAYTNVLIGWGSSWIVFDKPAAFDMFANAVNTGIPVGGFATSDPTLAGWVTAAGGAELCVAASSPNVRPGDSSWAIKPATDTNNACGCDTHNWVGSGAFYGGTPSGQEDPACEGWGGGWAGVKASGVQKGGIAPTVPTLIWIR